MFNDSQFPLPQLPEEPEEDLSRFRQQLLATIGSTQLPPTQYIHDTWLELKRAIQEGVNTYHIKPIIELGRNKVRQCWRAASRWGLGIYVPRYDVLLSPIAGLQAWTAYQDQIRNVEETWQDPIIRFENGRLSNAIDSIWMCAYQLFALGAFAGLQIRQEQLPPTVVTQLDPHYFPRLRIALENVSGQERFRIKLTPQQTGGRLEVYLEATNVDQTNRGNLFVFLVSRFQVFRFQQTVWENGRLKASLFVTKATDFHLLNQIISNDGASGRLIARQVVELAFQTNYLDELAMQRLNLPENESDRQALIQNLLTEITDLEEEIVKGLAGENFGASQNLGANIVRLHHKRKQYHHLQNPDPLYAIWPHVFEQVIEPHNFTFAPELFPYIYPGDH